MFDHCLYFITTAVARRLEQEWAEAFESLGLTPPQAFMLRSVPKRPELRQSQLSDELSTRDPRRPEDSTALRPRDISNVTAQSDGRKVSICPTSKAVRITVALNTRFR
jgi:hypothetical protein